MFKVGGFWIPDGDESFAKRLGKEDPVDGRAVYRHDRLTKALEHLPPDRRRVALDIGAHCGVYTYQLAKHFGQVFAFEPARPNFECLLKNMQPCKYVYKYQYAIGNTSGTLRIYQGDDTKNVRWSALLDHGDYCDVQMITIDSLDMHNIDYIRVDVKGYEPQVIEGAVETIKRCRPLVMIDERFDPGELATKTLRSLGLRQVWSKRYDRMFK
jgi:FkbM family methyltransferase